MTPWQAKLENTNLVKCHDSTLSTVWLEITTLLIPGENDSSEEINRMTDWLVQNLSEDVPVHFSAFHPHWKMLNYPPTPPATWSRAREIAMTNGLKYVYTGNVHDMAGSVPIVQVVASY